MDHEVFDLFVEGLRALFLIVVPVTGIVAAAGLAAGVLQAMTSINDSASAYAARLLGLLVAAYLFFSAFSSVLLRLAERAFGPRV